MRPGACLVVFTVAASACNAVSGASDLTIADTPPGSGLPPRSPTGDDGGATPPGSTPPGTTPPEDPPPAVPPTSFTGLRDITFEAGSLTGTNGFDAITGTPSIESAAPIVGVHSMRASAATSYGSVTIAPAAELWLGLVFRVETIGSAATPTLGRVTFGPTDPQGVLQIQPAPTTSAPTLSLAFGASSAGIGGVTLGAVVHVGIHVSGTKVEVFRADGAAAFGTKPAASLGGLVAGSVSKLELGRLSAEAVDAVFDDVRVSATEMPPF